MYESSMTEVDCPVGVMDGFKVHQGSGLSPFSFAMKMNRLTNEFRQESPWTIMFADDIMIHNESGERVDENLERLGICAVKKN